MKAESSSDIVNRKEIAVYLVSTCSYYVSTHVHNCHQILSCTSVESNAWSYYNVMLYLEFLLLEQNNRVPFIQLLVCLYTSLHKHSAAQSTQIKTEQKKPEQYKLYIELKP